MTEALDAEGRRLALQLASGALDQLDADQLDQLDALARSLRQTPGALVLREATSIAAQRRGLRPPPEALRGAPVRRPAIGAARYRPRPSARS